MAGGGSDSVRGAIAARVRSAALAICAGLWIAAPSARAQSAAAPDPAPARPEVTIGSTVTEGPCVVVEVAGHRVGTLDCAGQRLQDAARQARDQALQARDLEVPSARSADVVTGVANRTATRQRMGDQFGVGVRPQRPPTPSHAPPLGRRP